MSHFVECVDTFFAPAERARDNELQKSIEIVSKNPVIDTVIKSVGGLLAVLNEHRQILVVNDTLLAMLGIKDASQVLGLRPGEAIDCIHAHEQPGGCGTSKFCSTCGAAIAIVVCLGKDKPQERECVLSVERDGKPLDLYFQVRCYPLTFERQRFLLLFLQDMTVQQQRAALERMFFHDLNNLIGALKLNSQLLDYQQDAHGVSKLAQRIQKTASRLAKEVEIQRTLSCQEPYTYQLALQDVSVGEMIQEICEIFASHPAAQDKRLHLPEVLPNLYLNTDLSLLQRILTNMLMNAFEATDRSGEVKLWLEQADDTLTFCVWNDQPIPQDITWRVFQRNFSTKQQAGRGMGTYSMKLFGETYLRGKVNFTTEKEGTVFRLCLPKKLSQVRTV